MTERRNVGWTETSDYQTDISDLIRRFKKEAPEKSRSFGPLLLSDPSKQTAYFEGDPIPMRLTKFEYVLLWGLISVSRPNTSEGGILTTSDIARLLESVIKESQERGASHVKAPNSTRGAKDTSHRLSNWYNEPLPQGYGSIHVIISRLNKEFSQHNRGISIINRQEKSMKTHRGYYLTITK